MKLLRLFLGNPGTSYYVREIARRVESQIHAVRRELENLEDLGIITDGTPPIEAPELQSRMRKYYRLDDGFFLMSELRSLVLKSQFLLEQEFRRRVQKLGSLRYFALLGLFIGEEPTADATPLDALIVGTVNRQHLARFMRKFERDIGRSIHYAVMSVREFHYRRDVGDRFLYEVLEGRKKIVVIDELTPHAKAQRAMAALH